MAGEGRPSTVPLYAGSKDLDGGADPRVKAEDRHDDEARATSGNDSVVPRQRLIPGGDIIASPERTIGMTAM